jgi:geranylgeranyl reductase family protein
LQPFLPEKLTCDVFIVGGGPAGSLAGYSLAKRGFKTVIIDKATFPREKICAGGISKKALQLLDFDCSSIAHRKISGAYITFKNKDKILIHNKTSDEGYTYMRSEFDGYLMDKAIGQGAIFIDSCEYLSSNTNKDIITILTSKGEYKAKHLIGADGVLSKVRDIHFTEKIKVIPVLEAWIYVPESILDIYRDKIVIDFGIHKQGYGWIFPKKDHLNVGLYSIFHSKNLKSNLMNFISHYNSLRQFKDIQLKSFCIPKTYIKNPRKGNIWLTGDAAGFAESFFGEGIYFALKSSIITAEAIENTFSNNGFNNYYQRLNKEIQTQLKYSKLTAWWFYKFQKIGFYQIARNSYLNRLFAGFLIGNITYKQCFERTLLTLPYWVFQPKVKFEEELL